MSSNPGDAGRLRLITDVLRSFADATTDYARLLETIAQGVSGVVGLTCSIRLLTEGGDKLRTAAIFDPDNDALVPALASEDIPITPEARIALDSPRALVQKIHTQQTVNSAHADAYEKLQLREVLIAPLLARGEALGLLFVSRRGRGDDTFTQDDIDLVEALATHGALAIANARLLVSLESVERARAHERSIIDTVAAPLVLVDKQGLVVGANRAFLQVFELVDAEAIGQSFLTIADGALDVLKLRELVSDLPPSGPPIDGVEVELVTPTGLRCFLIRTKKTFRPGNGSETTLITLIDLTDRKLAEAGARRRALLVRSMSEALVGLDTQFNVNEWNPAAERLFGWTSTEAMGQNIADVFAIYEGPTTRNDNRRVLATGGTIRSQSRIKNKFDLWVDVEYSMMPLVVGGQTTGYVVVLLDVTKRYQLERDLRARLEQLTQANSELESFSYSVSHDLRAPVRAIDGFSEILEEEQGKVLDEEGRRMLALVRKNAKRMGLLIDDILALSRFSRQPLVTQKVDIDALAKAALEDALRAEPTRKITPTFSTTPLPPILGDESLLRQVWFNLLTNAVKYTRGRDEAKIEISAAATDTDIVYTVKDNGAGFDMRYADKLFGVFERLHSMKDFEGTGIGLALVQRIVKRHAGRVWGEGEVGKGATFHVALPKEPKKGDNA